MYISSYGRVPFNSNTEFEFFHTVFFHTGKKVQEGYIRGVIIENKNKRNMSLRMSYIVQTEKRQVYVSYNKVYKTREECLNAIDK